MVSVSVDVVPNVQSPRAQRILDSKSSAHHNRNKAEKRPKNLHSKTGLLNTLQKEELKRNLELANQFTENLERKRNQNADRIQDEDMEDDEQSNQVSSDELSTGHQEQNDTLINEDEFPNAKVQYNQQLEENKQGQTLNVDQTDIEENYAVDDLHQRSQIAAHNQNTTN